MTRTDSPNPPAFRRAPMPAPTVPGMEAQTAALHVVAIRACLLEVKLRTRGITQPQLRAELQRMHYLLDEIEGKA